MTQPYLSHAWAVLEEYDIQVAGYKHFGKACMRKASISLSSGKVRPTMMVILYSRFQVRLLHDSD